MRALQDAIEKTLSDLPEQLFSKLIDRKLAAQNVRLSSRRRKTLIAGLRRGEDSFTFNRWIWWRHRQITLDFSQRELEEIQQLVEGFLENHVPDLIGAIVKSSSREILAGLKSKWRAESRLQHRDLAGFRKRLHQHWKTPLDGLRMQVTISREFGAIVIQEVRNSSDANSRKHLIEVLARLHARACQIMEEIIFLLQGGFADGAMARWRTLHEVAVVSSYIAEHGEILAERYVLHEVVESKRAADDYTRCHQDLGFEPLSEEEIAEINRLYDDALERYGPDFGKGDFGWASQQLGNKKPTFKDIEHEVGIGYLRSHYRMASYNVHANPKGVFFRLGLLAESQVFLAGPSNSGLGEPGQSAALSLSQVSSALAALQLTIDNQIALRILRQLVGEVSKSFGEAQCLMDANDSVF